MLLFSNYKPSRSKYKYKIASKIFISDLKINELSLFLINKKPLNKHSDIIKFDDFSNAIVIYTGPGIIGEKTEKILFLKKNNLYSLNISNVLQFNIIHNFSTKIFLSPIDSLFSNNSLLESLLGPVLIFCLALDSIFCIHASAVKYSNKTILFLGGSGSGKSTIAEYLNDHLDGKFERIADDIVPLSIINNKLYALPHFPQLKLQQKHQYPINKPSRVKVSAVYLLNKDNRRRSVNIEALKPGQKIASLISNTVASRLFDRELNLAHINFCSYITQNIELKKLNFPHNRNFLEDILSTIILV